MQRRASGHVTCGCLRQCSSNCFASTSTETFAPYCVFALLKVRSHRSPVRDRAAAKNAHVRGQQAITRHSGRRGRRSNGQTTRAKFTRQSSHAACAVRRSRLGSMRGSTLCRFAGGLDATRASNRLATLAGSTYAVRARAARERLTAFHAMKQSACRWADVPRLGHWTDIINCVGASTSSQAAQRPPAPGSP